VVPLGGESPSRIRKLPCQEPIATVKSNRVTKSRGAKAGLEEITSELQATPVCPFPRTGTTMASIVFAARVGSQNSHDGDHGVPTPCRGEYTEQFVDLAKIANRFHVTTVHSKDESVFQREP